jgi:outer membrane protein TolC
VAAQRSLALAQTSYRVDKADLRAVQQQQLNLYSARLVLPGVQSEQPAQRANRYLALGGCFENPPAQPATIGTTQ